MCFVVCSTNGVLHSRSQQQDNESSTQGTDNITIIGIHELIAIPSIQINNHSYFIKKKYNISIIKITPQFNHI